MTIRTALVVSSVALGLVSGCAHHREYAYVAPTKAMEPSAAYTAPEASPEAAPFDREFLDRLVAHYERGIDLARVGLAEGEHPEVRGLAADLVTAQQGDVDVLRTLRSIWYEEEGLVASSTQNADKDEEPARDLEQLAATDRFDRKFLDAVIAHHEEGIELARTALERPTDHPELQELATVLIYYRGQEAARIREWRSIWYPALGSTSVPADDGARASVQAW